MNWVKLAEAWLLFVFGTLGLFLVGLLAYFLYGSVVHEPGGWLIIPVFFVVAITIVSAVIIQGR